MSPIQDKTSAWLARGRVGESSRCMAMWLAFGQRTAWLSHPHDPDDLDRCLKLLEWVPELREEMGKMAHLTPEWAALIKRWGEIENSHLTEVGLGWTKARSAPKTFALMRSILDTAERRAPTPTVQGER